VRQDQRSPTFEVLDWTVEPIQFAKILETTGGLYRFSGHGQDAQGAKPWSVVLKILKKPAQGDGDPRDVFYWKREPLAFQSGLLADFPDAIRAPRCYGVIERDDGGWLWMEYIVESTERRWSLEHFQRAARQLGRFGGAYLTGRPLPDQPWLSRSVLRTLNTPSGFWATLMNPDSPKNAWQSPVVQQAFAEPLRSHVLRIWADLPSFIDAMERLPQVLCHNDLNRRNLMLCTSPEGQQEVVVLDWAWMGNGAIGSDAGWLVSDGLFLFDYDPAQAAELSAAVLDVYLAGLREAGWAGDERLARLGFSIMAASWIAILPGWAAMMLGEESTTDLMAMYGHSADAVLTGWVTLTKFLLEHADEATHLMRELNLD
jgi:hypothetical protein